MTQTRMRTLLKFLSLILLIFLIGGCTPSGDPIEIKKISNQSTDDQVGEKSRVLPNGSKVDDLDVSGVTTIEAQTKIMGWAKDKLEETRVLLYNETVIPITLKDLGIEVDHQKTTEEIEHNPGTIQPSILKVDTLKASQELQEKLKEFSRPAKDASYKVEKDKFVVSPAESGLTVDIDKLISNIQRLPLGDIPNQMEIPIVEVPASVTTEAVQSLAFDTIIGEFTTKFSVREKNRSSNLIAAAKSMDRKVIRPGEIFSFNDIVGPRETETGYKSAYVIVNGEFVQGTGGGVCQVSSTLYNAVLLSNLAIVERIPHAVAVSYVPPGQDATVNYPNIDFKFKNDTTNILYLRAEVISGILSIRIWGKKTDKSVRIERQIEKVMKYKTERRWDSKLRSGRIVQEQAGSKGIVVNTWKVIRDGTGIETKQFLSRDVYAPASRILRVGSRGIPKM